MNIENKVIAAVLDACWPYAHGAGFTRDGQQQYAKQNGPVGAENVARHIRGEQPFTVFLAEPGGERTRLAVVDIDNKEKYDKVLDADGLRAVAAALVTAAHDLFGLRATLCVSRSGTGRNLWFMWEHPQPCADVREALLEVAAAAGLVEGKGGGVGSGQCELYVNASQGVALPGFARNAILTADGDCQHPAPILVASDDVPKSKRRAVRRQSADLVAPPPVTMDRVKVALGKIPPEDYDDWLRVGLVLKTVLGGGGRELWQQWSAGSSKYDAGTVARKWEGLKPRGGLTVATIFWLARRHGWVDPTLPCTQFGNKDRFCEQHGERLRYVLGVNEWLHYGHGVWHRNPALAAKKCEATIKSIYAEAAATADPELAKRLASWAASSQNKRELDAVLGLAKHEPSIVVAADELDADPWLLGVRNGVLDLRTGQLLPHNAELLITKTLGCDYVLGAACPRWQQFISECFPHAAVRAYVQRLVGHLLTGDTSERCVWFLQGDGDNGKSVMVAVLQALLGDYSVNVEPHTFMAKRDDSGATPDIARLAGARLALVHELSDRMTMNLPLLKRAAGGSDRMTARHLYGQPFEFQPRFKTVFITNRLPRIGEDDDAVWKRVRVVHFGVQVPKERQDPKLVEKLRAEMPGILAWALEGCLQWQREGGLGAAQPGAVTDDSLKYRHSQNTIDQWLDGGAVERGAEYRCQSQWLYNAFQRWCIEEQGIPAQMVTRQVKFSEALGRRGFSKRRDTQGVWWLGLRLAPGTREADERARF